MLHWNGILSIFLLVWKGCEIKVCVFFHCFTRANLLPLHGRHSVYLLNKWMNGYMEIKLSQMPLKPLPASNEIWLGKSSEENKLKSKLEEDRSLLWRNTLTNCVLGAEKSSMSLWWAVVRPGYRKPIGEHNGETSSHCSTNADKERVTPCRQGKKCRPVTLTLSLVYMAW